MIPAATSAHAKSKAISYALIVGSSERQGFRGKSLAYRASVYSDSTEASTRL